MVKYRVGTCCINNKSTFEACSFSSLASEFSSALCDCSDFARLSDDLFRMRGQLELMDQFLLVNQDQILLMGSVEADRLLCEESGPPAGVMR